MDEKAPITWLLNEFRSNIGTLAENYAGVLTTAITPLVAAGFGLYLLLITLNYWRGTESNPVADFITRLGSWGVVIGLGLNSDRYNSTVIPMVTGIGEELANMLTGGTVNANSIDMLALYYLDVIEKGFEAAAGIGGLEGIGVTILVSLKALIVVIGLAPFLVTATVMLLSADIGAMLLAMLGPLYFSFLLFPATRSWFSSWLNAVKSHALIPVIIAAVATFSVSVSMKALSDGGTLVDASFKRIFLAAFINGILLAVLYKVSSIASALSSGGLNISTAGGVGGAAKAMRDSARGSNREMKQAAKAVGAARSAAKSIGARLHGNTIKKGG